MTETTGQKDAGPFDRLVAWVGRRGGLVWSTDARDAGFSPGLIQRAVASGVLRRIRRSWIATPECDELRAAAASISGRVTCVSAAQMAGLWVPEHGETHLAVDPGSSRFDATGAVVHWAKGPVPPPRHEVVDPLLNVLFHVARCLPRADALAVWESAVNKRQVAPEVLKRVRWRSTAAAAIAEVAHHLSDSGLETRFCELMRAAGIAVRQQVVVDGHPIDALVGERLAVQLDGFEFHRAADRRRDLRADVRLTLRGYAVLRFDYEQIFFEPDYVIGAVQHACAQQLHRAS